MKDLKNIEQALNNPIPRSSVSEREGPFGRKLSYLQAHYVIDLLNQTFGPLGWSSHTEEVRLIHTGQGERKGKPIHTAHYLARVMIQVQAKSDDGKVFQTSHMGTGYGDGDDAQNVGKAHELAMKEAESDALKRAAKNLGMAMGLALYDKDQTNVADDAAKPEEVQAPKSPGAASQSASTTPVPAASSAATVSPSRPKAEGVHADRGQGAPNNRAKLNENLAKVARVLNDTGKQPFAITKQVMQEKYGASTKEQLSDAQADELYKSLSALAG